MTVFYSLRNTRTGRYLSYDDDETSDINEMFTPYELFAAEAALKLLTESGRCVGKFVIVRWEVTTLD